MLVLRHEGTHGWCDVCAHPDGFAWVYSIGGVDDEGKPKGGFVCEVNGVEVWRRTIEGLDFPRYIDCVCTLAGNVIAIGVGGDDHAYGATAVGDADLGLVHGQNAVALDVTANDHVRVYLMQDSHSYLKDGIRHPVSLPDPQGTSQGFRDVANGRIVWADTSHVKTQHGVNLHQWVERGDLVVGQINGPDRIDGFVGTQRFTAIELRSIAGPKIAQRGTQYAICAPTTRGAAMNIVPPYPPVFGDPPPPPPPPDKEPPVAETTPNHADYVVRRWRELNMSAIGAPLNDEWRRAADQTPQDKTTLDRLHAIMMPKHADFAHRIARELFDGADGAKPGLVGLIEKGGTNHRGRSTDVILLPVFDSNGRPIPNKHGSVKIVGATGAPEAKPIWNELWHEHGFNRDPWKEPFPVDGVVVTPPDDDEDGPPVDDPDRLVRIEAKQDRIEQKLDRLLSVYRV